MTYSKILEIQKKKETEKFENNFKPFHMKE